MKGRSQVSPGRTEKLWSWSLVPNMASQLPWVSTTWPPWPPRVVLWTVAVWYGSSAFSIRSFQLHGTSKSRLSTQTRSAKPYWPRISGILPKCSRKSGPSGSKLMKTQPSQIAWRGAVRPQSALSKPIVSSMPGAPISSPSRAKVQE